MTTYPIQVHCTACNTPFQMTHPAVKNTRTLSKITFSCRNCSATLMMAEYMMIAEPVDNREKRLKQDLIGHTAKVTPLFRGKDDGIRPEHNTIEHKTTKPIDPSNLPNSPLADNAQLKTYLETMNGKN